MTSAATRHLVLPALRADALSLGTHWIYNPAKIARRLAHKGIATLRFDFTGIGDNVETIRREGSATVVFMKPASRFPVFPFFRQEWTCWSNTEPSWHRRHPAGAKPVADSPHRGHRSG